MPYASHVWNNGWQHHRRCGPPGRALEIVGIILGFFYAWPLALAYLVWKLMGYPVPNEVKEFLDRNFSRLSDSFRPRPHFSSTGNFAFEEYRRREIERLEQERRRLDEEARGFAEFVEELKRAKDREEFEAFMAKRRSGQASA